MFIEEMLKGRRLKYRQTISVCERMRGENFAPHAFTTKRSVIFVDRAMI